MCNLAVRRLSIHGQCSSSCLCLTSDRFLCPHLRHSQREQDPGLQVQLGQRERKRELETDPHRHNCLSAAKHAFLCRGEGPHCRFRSGAGRLRRAVGVFQDWIQCNLWHGDYRAEVIGSLPHYGHTTVSLTTKHPSIKSSQQLLIDCPLAAPRYAM